MTPLNIVLVSDGKPGHFRLSEGIVAAIARRRQVAVTRLEVRRPRLVPGSGWTALTYSDAWQGAIPRLLGIAARPVTACDLVVSAGGATLAANIYLKRTYSCANIFYGSLRRYHVQDFSLVLTSYTSVSHRSNHLMTLKPSALDPDSLPKVPETGGPPFAVGLLVGGDSGTVHFRHADWDRLLKLLDDTPHDVRWIVSNSRRTPEPVSNKIARIAAAEPGRVQFIDVRKPDAPDLVAAMTKVSVIAATIDSSSMISEAVWARRPVVVLAPEKWDLPVLEEGYRKYLNRHGWTSEPVPLAAATPGGILEHSKDLKPLQDNPLEQLAILIENRVPSLFGQLSSQPLS